jgi:hypothetical protein
MVYAVINSQTNVVENTIVWDGVSPWAPPENCYVEPITNPHAGIGWSFANGEWIAPTPQTENL